VVDLKGNVYEEAEKISSETTGEEVKKGQWYVGAFHQDAVLLRERKKEQVRFPPPRDRGQYGN